MIRFNYRYIFLVVIILLQGKIYAQSPSKGTEAIAELVLKKALADTDLGLYPGSLLMHGMSELAVFQKDPQTLHQALGIFADFKTGKIDGRGSFISYKAGGSGAAYLYYLKKSDALREQVELRANEMFKSQKRSSEGIVTANWAKDSLDQIFIDIAFAVTPYMLYAGMAMQKPEYVDIAVKETLLLFDILRDTNGLLRQARGFTGLGILSEDNWSRGNGWGAFALASLVRDLPDTHPKKQEVNRVAKNFFEAVLKYQNQEGLWNQEMTEPLSYIETSGSGLLLYGIGIAIEKNILDKAYLPQFVKGLSGYTSYIAPDGSVSNTCRGCLNPGKGTKKDYIQREWILNDHHAFGPVVLAFTQALKMGIKEVTPAKCFGCYVTDFDKPRKPQTYVRYMPEANGNIVWENDRVGFRVYGPLVKDRVSSGIDIWTKSVPYPVIDKWYSLNKMGKPYHIDRGEGCDFFHVGYSRGNGGTAIWHNGKPYISAPYTTHRILKNTEGEIAFELNFEPWEVDGRQVSETKVISMKMGDNFFKVVSTFQSSDKKPLPVVVGIAYAKKPEIIENKKTGTLTVWESYLPENGELGTTVVVNPKQIKNFTSFDKERFVLVNAKSGEAITYYVGAGWSKAPQFKSRQDWLTYVNSELSKMKF